MASPRKRSNNLHFSHSSEKRRSHLANQLDPLSILNIDVLYIIFEFLTTKQLLQYTRVSKLWLTIINAYAAAHRRRKFIIHFVPNIGESESSEDGLVFLASALEEQQILYDMDFGKDRDKRYYFLPDNRKQLHDGRFEYQTVDGMEDWVEVTELRPQNILELSAQEDKRTEKLFAVIFLQISDGNGSQNYGALLMHASTRQQISDDILCNPQVYQTLLPQWLITTESQKWIHYVASKRHLLGNVEALELAEWGYGYFCGGFHIMPVQNPDQPYEF